MIEQSSQQLPRKETWFRLLFVLLFLLISGVAEFVLMVVIVLQFGFVLICRERNRRLLAFGASLSKYFYLVLRFITFNTEQKPFPFGDWPEADEPDAGEHETTPRNDNISPES